MPSVWQIEDCPKLKDGADLFKLVARLVPLPRLTTLDYPSQQNCDSWVAALVHACPYLVEIRRIRRVDLSTWPMLHGAPPFRGKACTVRSDSSCMRIRRLRSLHSLPQHELMSLLAPSLRYVDLQGLLAIVCTDRLIDPPDVNSR
jgi:hypothetical protein